jgi:hypothetical protein
VLRCGFFPAALGALAVSALLDAATGLPFFLAGGLKFAYDLALYFRFRRVPLPGESKGGPWRVTQSSVPIRIPRVNRTEAQWRIPACDE